MTLRHWLTRYRERTLYRPATGRLCRIDELVNAYSVYLDAQVIERGPVVYFASYTRESGVYPEGGVAIRLEDAA